MRPEIRGRGCGGSVHRPSQRAFRSLEAVYRSLRRIYQLSQEIYRSLRLFYLVRSSFSTAKGVFVSFSPKKASPEDRLLSV
ncbi:hypothetical protein OYT88_08165 [Sporolactobacillus sp. CQH2019]|uniref:hypothetical protein n=1 Tax=Sporolactobacillus sp. CQH2019 TaxID=3023512 RepID=UPI002368C322|nr:hypothetical protein [Sporolactobacillus sp. CQH2019]MDD9148519.1 hypothetical protein [Sporolactobacillus sp. CQH2019]